MRMISTILSLCLLIFSLTTCASGRPDTKEKNITRNVSVSGNPDAILSAIAGDIVYKEGSPSVKIYGPSESVNAITVKQKGTSLEIYSEEHSGRWNNAANNRSTKVDVTVTLPYLRSVTLQGSGDLTASLMTGHQVSIKTMGSGDVNVNRIEAPSVKITSGGSGDCELGRLMASNITAFSQGSGDISMIEVETASFKITLSGSGDFEISKLESSQVEVSVQGTGEAELYGIDTNVLRASVSGTGNINLKGSASTAFLSSGGTGFINATDLNCSRINSTEQSLDKIIR